MLTAKEQSLLAAILPKAEEFGIEIVTVEVVGAKKAPTIRVYIDAPGGISFDELSTSQVWINDILDEIDPFPGAYSLEVSSPGIDRPLRTLEHFERFVGETAVIQTQAPIQGRSKWTGVLAGVKNGFVLLEIDGITEEIEYENVKRAHIRGTIDWK